MVKWKAYGTRKNRSWKLIFLPHKFDELTRVEVQFVNHEGRWFFDGPPGD